MFGSSNQDPRAYHALNALKHKSRFANDEFDLESNRLPTRVKSPRNTKNLRTALLAKDFVIESSKAKTRLEPYSFHIKTFDYPLIFIKSRQDLVERFFNCYPSIARSSRLQTKIVAFYDKDIGCLVALAPNQSCLNNERQSTLDHRKTVKLLQAAGGGEIFVPLLNTLILQGSSKDQRYDERSIFQFIKSTEDEAVRHKFSVAVPALAGITEKIENFKVFSALKSFFLHPLINPDNIEVAANFLNPRLSELYLSRTSSRHTEEKLLLIIQSLSEVLDRLANHRDNWHAAKNLIEVLDTIQHSGFLKGMDTERSKAELNFIRDFKSFLEEKENFRVTHGEKPRHIKMKRAVTPEVSYLASYSVPSVLLDGLFEKISNQKCIQSIANFYSLVDRSTTQWLNYFHQLLNIKDLPFATKGFFSEVSAVVGRLSAQNNVAPETEVDPKDSAYREISISGQLDNYRYKLTISLRSLAPLLSLSREVIAAHQVPLELLGVGKQGDLEWTTDAGSSQMARVSTRFIMPSNRWGSLETTLNALLKDASKHKLIAFSESRLLGKQQLVRLDQISSSQFLMELRLRYREQESHQLIFENGRLSEVQQSKVVEDIDGGKEQLKPLKYGLLNIKDGYPFILDIIESLRREIETLKNDASDKNDFLDQSKQPDRNIILLEPASNSSDGGADSKYAQDWLDDMIFKESKRHPRARRGA